MEYRLITGSSPKSGAVIETDVMTANFLVASGIKLLRRVYIGKGNQTEWEPVKLFRLDHPNPPEAQNNKGAWVCNPGGTD